jgi:ribonuclease HI
MAKEKFYVIWEGIKPGIYNSWKECQANIKGFPGAKYKSFETLQEAESALKGNYWTFVNKKISTAAQIDGLDSHQPKPTFPALAVDAACNTVTGDMEYRGVDAQSAREYFRQGPYKNGTNNIGEFLAIVHGLALLKRNNSHLPIYTDSKTALAWIRNKHAKTTLARIPENEILFEMIARAEKWLKENTWKNQLLKWETKIWGEIPADFGRK